MSAIVIYRGEPREVASAFVDGDNLWLSSEDLRASTGWELKPQGLCLDDRCVPIPVRRKAEFLDARNRINLTVFARHLGQPVVHDDARSIWLFGEAAEATRDALQSLQAPDFTLPDLDGKLHSLANYRGQKVLLLSWASW
jgi:hypothetical protein